MNSHAKIVLSLCLLGLLVMAGYKGFQFWQDERQQVSGTDARHTKGTITLARDGWVGYHLLCSEEMTRRMRSQGYLLRCVDDMADYRERFKKLDAGDYQFAVATVDSYLQNAEKINYSAPVVAVIDESKGGDAIVALQSKVVSIEAVKGLDDVKVAYTPNSPSEHLLRAVRSHFDILPRQWLNRWQRETDGSEAALEALQKGDADIAVLWEPEVTRALEDKRFIRLLGTEDTQKLIVDILLVNRRVLQEQPELVGLFLKNYFQTLRHYRSQEQDLVDELKGQFNLSADQVRQLLSGVEWKSLTDNAEDWFGSSGGANHREYLFDTIEAAQALLIEDEVFNSSPIPNQDPYRLISSGPITELYKNLAGQNLSGPAKTAAQAFAALTETEWQGLRQVGTFKVRPITFASGTSDLTIEGQQQIDSLLQNLQHYPKFRVEIRGHTGTRGDIEANLLLSQARADEVYQYLLGRLPESLHRFRAKGFGGGKPLTKQPGESSRAYHYRLPRVEIVLLSAEI